MKSLETTQTLSFSGGQTKVKLEGKSSRNVWDEMAEREAKSRSEEGFERVFSQLKEGKQEDPS